MLSPTWVPLVIAKSDGPEREIPVMWRFATPTEFAVMQFVTGLLGGTEPKLIERGCRFNSDGGAPPPAAHVMALAMSKAPFVLVCQKSERMVDETGNILRPTRRALAFAPTASRAATKIVPSLHLAMI